MALKPPPKAALLRSNCLTQKPKQRPAKQRRATSTSSPVEQQLTPNHKSSTPTDPISPVDTNSVTPRETPSSPALEAYNKAAAEAEKARKLNQQVSQHLLRKADAFIFDLKQVNTTELPEITQAIASIQQFVIKTAQALVHGKPINQDQNTISPELDLQGAATSISALATSTLNKQPPAAATTNHTWASIAGRHKPENLSKPLQKTVTHLTQTLKASINQTRQQEADNRFFVRLSSEHSLRQLHPYHI